MADKQWSGSTFGSGGLLNSLTRSLRVLPPGLLYVFSYVFVIPFCVLFSRRSRRVSYRFFRHRIGDGRIKSAWKMYVNHGRFAEAVIDKFAMYAGRRFKVNVDGVEYFNHLAARPEGFLLLSSHIGNYEIAGYSLVSTQKPIHAIVFQHEKEAVMQGRGNMFEKTCNSMIALQEDMSHLFEIDKALCDGDIVSFPADRFMGGAKSLECEFWGVPAKFPQGPFSVATMRGLDVLSVNVMKEGWKKYRVIVRPLGYDKTAARKEQTAQLLHAYVAELQNTVKQYPTQWYNFYDFWTLLSRKNREKFFEKIEV